jgi:hypothetical protein
MLLSPHFTLAELTISQEAARRGLDNTPTPEILDRMKTITAPGMELVRACLGAPIQVSSGYRSPKVNRAVGGASTSAHQWGWAVDFIAPGAGSPLTVARKLESSDIEFDQLIHEFGTWVHISFEPRKRGQVLTIDRQGTRAGLVPIRRPAAA